jgi:hypothetical protein
MRQQDIFRFEIAVNDFMMLQEHETLQQLFCESSDEFERKSSEVVGFDEFVKVHAEKIRGDAEVTTEVKALVEVDNAMLFMRILVYC